MARQRPIAVVHWRIPSVRIRDLVTLTATCVAATGGCPNSEAVLDELIEGDSSAPIEATARTNLPPFADAGDDETVGPGDAVTLDGTQSFDPNADRLMFTWRQIGGPEVDLDGGFSSAARFIAPTAMTGPIQLTFRLTVADGRATHTDEVVISVSAN